MSLEHPGVDAGILQQLRIGNPEGVRDLLRASGPRVLCVLAARRGTLTQADVLAAIREAALDVRDAIAQYDAGTPLDAWFLMLADRKAVDVAIRRARERPPDADAGERADPTTLTPDRVTAAAPPEFARAVGAVLRPDEAIRALAEAAPVELPAAAIEDIMRAVTRPSGPPKPATAIGAPAGSDAHLRTNWTLIGELRSDDRARQDAAMERLVGSYHGPVYGLLRHLGSSPDEAVELTQEFFTEKVLRGRLFERADPRRARLRVLLAVAVKNFWIDAQRRGRSGVSGKTMMLGQLKEAERTLPELGTRDAVQVFQQRWAATVLQEAMRRCRLHYLQKKRGEIWEAFFARTVRPIASGARPRPQADIAEEVGMSSAGDVARAVLDVRRQMRIFLHEVVAETVMDGGTAKDEVRDLMELLSGPDGA